MPKKQLLLSLCIAALCSCQPPIQVVRSNNDRSPAYYSSHMESSWPSSHSFPVQLKHGSDLTTDEVSALKESTTNWNQGVGEDLFQVGSSNKDSYQNLNEFEDGELGVYKLGHWPSELPPTALAVTQIHGEAIDSDNIRITHADILLNYDYFTFSTDGSWGYDLQTVLVHELGHFLGLYHHGESAEQTVMYPSIGRDTENRIPKEVDINDILAKYPRAAVVAQKSNLLPNNTVETEKITLILELYPDGKERMRILKRRP